jgi:Kef-type K+ transport system membrane component KefB
MALEVSMLFQIAIILIFAKILGEMSERLKFSSLLGEVIAGILVGPILGWVQPSSFLEQIAQFGAIFLMFIIGLNTRFDDLKKDVYHGSFLALFGAALSFAAGFAVGYYFFNSTAIGMVLGVAIASTSAVVSLRTLIDVGEFRTNLYHKITMVLTADNVIAILALALLTSYLTFGIVEIWKILALFFAVLGFFFLILSAGRKFVPPIVDAFGRLKDEQILLSIPLVVLFLVAFASEQVGIAGVTGAFLAGMAMNRSPLAESVIAPKVKTIGYGFFIPLFFAYASLSLDLNFLAANYYIILVLLAAAAAAKFIGCGLASRIDRLKDREQTILGAAMIPRGEYAIIVAQAALGFAAVTPQVYTTIVSFVLLSILVTPLLLRLVHRMW